MVDIAWGGYFAMRYAAFEKRIVAAVAIYYYIIFVSTPAQRLCLPDRNIVNENAPMYNNLSWQRKQ
jgi:hypothetical protein